jgi:hypothetical protein
MRSMLGALALGAVSGMASAEPVTLTVEFRLTDLDDRPLPGVPVRLVLGAAPGWQGADAGHRFVTDDNGAHRLVAPAGLDKQWRKLTTNFFSTLMSRSQQTDHVRVAAELQYMTFSWLYAVDVYRFPGGGEVLVDGFSVYTRDSREEFTNQAKREAGGWIMADLGGRALTHPGHELGNVMLQPDPVDTSRWTLRMAFRKSPAPVQL